MRISYIATIVAVVGLSSIALSQAADPNADTSANTSADTSTSHQQSTSKAKMQQAAAHLKEACQADVQKFCSTVNPGQGRMAACLDSKQDQLSESCKTAWTDTKARISKKVDKTEVAFRKDCGSDVQKFCSDVPSGRGRLINCLSQHEDNLSNSCKNMQAKVKTKMDEMMS